MVVLNGGKLKLNRDFIAMMIRANPNTGDGTSTAIINGGEIVSDHSGTKATGILVRAQNDGVARIIGNGGKISFSDAKQAFGTYIFLINPASTAMAETIWNGGEIDITDTNTDKPYGSYGLRVYNKGLGASSITVNEADSAAPTVINISGRYSKGVGILTTTASNSADRTVSVSGGTITVSGLEASGAYISSNVSIGGKNIYLQSGGTVSASGSGSSGLYIDGSKTAYAIDITGGTLKGGSDTGAAIYVMGNGDSNTINIGNGAVIDGSDSGSAIKVLDSTGNNNVTVTIDGTVIGKVSLDSGDDELTIREHADVSKLPQLDGGAGTNTLNLESVSMKGFTASSNDDSGNDSSGNNVNLTKWKTVNLKDSSRLNLTGDLFTSSSTGTLNIGSGSSLIEGTMASTLYGDVNNSGLIVMNPCDTCAGRVLTLSGNYVGNSGTLSLGTVLGDDSSATDKLVVNGQASGTTYVTINNENGSGAKNLEGIEVIKTGCSTEDAFILKDRVIAGAHEYLLRKGTLTGNNLNNWYLSSLYSKDVALYKPELGSYASNMMAARKLFNMTLRDRVGESDYPEAGNGAKKVGSMWMRTVGSHESFTMNNGQNKTTGNRYSVQLGGDIAQWTERAHNRYHLGAMMGYGKQTSSTHNELTGYGSRGRVEGYSAGIYGTWYENEEEKIGAYVDSWLMYSWFNNKVMGESVSPEYYRSKGLTASLESGYTYQIGSYTTKGQMVNDIYVQPQFQVTWMGVKDDEHTESNGTHISGVGSDNVQTRLGARIYLRSHSLEENGVEFKPFIEANWLHNTKSSTLSMNGEMHHISGSLDVGEMKIGATGRLSKRLSLWGSVAQQQGRYKYKDSQAQLGIKYLF